MSDEKLEQLTHHDGGKNKPTEHWLANKLGDGTSFRTSEIHITSGDCKELHRLNSKGGMPQYRYEKECQEEKLTDVYMDTAALDLIAVNPNDPKSLEGAILYYGATQKQYYTDNLLLGRIVPPGVDARDPPADGAQGKSFAGNEAGLSLPVSGDLVGKKAAIAYCPPSMFTGKARLYAQAQYGRPLRDWRWELDIPTGLAPRIQYDHRREDEYKTVLNTSSGIYTDTSHGHWIVSPHSGGVLVTKLIRDDAVRPLVKYLSDSAMQDDWDKIEAYILAYSTPSATINFNISVDGIPQPQMLGYGWKFNWDGSKSDIIQHVAGSPTHTSTHYRLVITRNDTMVTNPDQTTVEQEQSRWSVTLSVVEGPVSWHNSKFTNVIASPDWGFNVLGIFGSLLGSHLGDAPVYCFYKEDDSLEVVRYLGIGGDVASRSFSGISEPACWWWVFDWTAYQPEQSLEGGTYGLEGAYGERLTRTHDPVTAGFLSPRCDATQSAQGYTYVSELISEKSPNGNDEGLIESHIAAPVYEREGVLIRLGNTLNYTTPDGVGVYSSGVTSETHTGALLGTQHYGYTHYIFGADVSREHRSGTHSETAYGLLVVPFHDAEAVYLYAYKHIHRASTGYGGAVTGYQHNGGVFRSWQKSSVLVPDTEPPEYWEYTAYYTYGGGLDHQPGTPGGTLDPEDIHTYPITTRKLLTRHGVFDYDPPSPVGAFFSGVDYVSQQYYTHSACIGPAVYGFGVLNLDGFPDRFPIQSPPPFIGWA